MAQDGYSNRKEDIVPDLGLGHCRRALFHLCIATYWDIPDDLCVA